MRIWFVLTIPYKSLATRSKFYMNNLNSSFCSDFRDESNGIFVLGVGFSSDKFRLFNQSFLTKIFLYHSKAIVVLSLNLKNNFTCDHFL